MRVLGLIVVVAVLATVLAGTVLARRLRIAEPIALIGGGALLGLIPQLGRVQLAPEVVLLLFLPALLYWESLTVSLREIRANLRVITLLSVGLVIATAASVAAMAHAFGVSWPVAFVLGAVLAPTDASATSTVARGLPRRAMITLRAESLLNDGTALVLFAVAVEAATSDAGVHLGDVSLRFLLAYAGGAAIGAAIAVCVIGIRRHLDDPLLGNVLSVLTPFAAYLPAQAADVSGVIAVVVAGLILSQAGPRMVRAETRMQATAFWELTTFALNGALFVLIGLQIPAAVRGLADTSLPRAVALALAATAAVMVTRLAWVYLTPYLIRAVDRRAVQRARRIPARQRLPAAWAGVRGAVSMAAALAVPSAVDGRASSARELIVFVTVVVILGTVGLQAQTMPAVVRWSRQPDDSAELTEELLARRHMSRAVLGSLDGHIDRLGVPAEVAGRAREQIVEHLSTLELAASAERHRLEHLDAQLRIALLAEKRAVLVQLRREGRIDDLVLRRIQADLDVEEVRLSRPHRWRHEAQTVDVEQPVPSAEPSRSPAFAEPPALREELA